MDLERMRRQAKADPSQYRHLLRNVLRELDDLRDGTSNGHHPLGFESGKGDLRDSVTPYISRIRRRRTTTGWFSGRCRHSGRTDLPDASSSRSSHGAVQATSTSTRWQG
jgi:hypothetical protein